MVEVTVGWGRQLEGTEADVVQSLVVDTVRLIGVFDELVNWECGVVWLDNCVWYLRTCELNVDMSEWVLE